MTIFSIYGGDPDEDPFGDFFAPTPKPSIKGRIPVRQRDSTSESFININEEIPIRKDILQPRLDIFEDDQSEH